MKIMGSSFEGVISRERYIDIYIKKYSGKLPNLLSVTDCFVYRFIVVK